jgi:hypothetical protein
MYNNQEMERDGEVAKEICAKRGGRAAATGTFGILLFAIVVGVVFAPQSAQAQNLVQNPLFVDALSGYQSLGSMINTQTTQTPGVSIAILFPGSVLTQSIGTTIGTQYMVSFFTSFANPTSQHDVLFASFGDGGITLDSAQGATNGVFRFSATATDTTSVLRFAEGPGVNVLTALDVQAGPAPIPGAGGLSCLTGLAALAGVAIRRRRIQEG